MKIFILLVVSLFFRLIYLGVVPVSIAHDETDNIIQAHSLIQTGSDIVGTWQPFALLPNSGVMSELGPFINTAVLSIFPNNLFTNRLTTALLSSLFPLLLLYWLKTLKVDSKVGYISAFMLAVSPWHILFSRTVLEQPTSLFFYLLSWIYLSKVFQKIEFKKSYYLNSILFALFYSIGFFTYHGYKFSLPILTGVLVLWHIWDTNLKTQYIRAIFPILVICSLLIRTFIMSDHYASRESELLFFNTSSYEKIIDQDRRLSLAPELLKKLYSNKPVKLVQNMKDKYLGALNPDLLYSHGESNGVFSTWQTGYLYLFTIPFLVVGLGYLIMTHSKQHILILVLLLLSPLASIIHVNNTLAFRSGIYFVFLNIITAYGLIEALKLLLHVSLKLRYFIYTIFGCIFLSSIMYFSYIYFFVTPVTNANAYFYSDRVIANYLRLSPNSKTLLLVRQPRYLYSAVILTHSDITRSDIASFNHLYSPTDLDYYQTNNLTIVRNCKDVTSNTYETVIVDKNMLIDMGDCVPIRSLTQNNAKLLISSFVSPKDSGEEYRIFGDKLCDGIDLSTYVHPTDLKDFNLESMNREDFCSKWVVRQ